MSEPPSSRIPLEVHTRLTGTIAVAGTVPALAVFLLARPTEIIESTALWFVLFPLTCALAGGLFAPKIRQYLPESYPRAERQRLRAVVFTVALLVANYTIATALMVVSVVVGVLAPPTGESSPLIPGLFVVLLAVALPPLPSAYVHRKHRKATAEFAHEAKSRGFAAILALLGGGLGIHKFYVGERRTAVKYLLFCWTIVPWALGIRAADRYARMDPADFRRKIADTHDEPLPNEGGPLSDEGEPPSAEDGPVSAEDESRSDAADERLESTMPGEWFDPNAEDERDGASEFSDVSEPLSSDEPSTSSDDSPTASSDDSPSVNEFFSQDVDSSSVETSSSLDDSSPKEGELDELERLYDLYEKGALAEEEYVRKTSKLLDGE